MFQFSHVSVFIAMTVLLVSSFLNPPNFASVMAFTFSIKGKYFEVKNVAFAKVF